ncbi:MaoC/PaaZ C-terminal domain-containing protein [Modestobacter sp. Leaf380]|uniref:MaoC/PaaZ C-terminal domain-containing protein n=1 Tax=Modestobacter sp. Leaf380 TaxID=1736356 RepID=UPI000700971B|nr:MaoC/PaaZ C-terminal domain-containing protein [Modestobacter sp. Leaf380]KQS71203.1 dehydratase [Modestobacter sp. Leaf380]
MGTPVVLSSAPSMAKLFAQAAVTARGRGGSLPDTHLARVAVEVDPGQVADYAQVCRFPLADTLPPTFPHVLTFPLQVALMADRAFPLALPGLVHVRNRVDVVRPVGVGERLDLEVWADAFAPHRSGATVDLVASVRSRGDEVWRGRSTYLARGATAPGAPADVPELTIGDVSEAAVWRVPDDAGRRYAKVSGDVNPIHLSGLTAKAFGFKRAIAHGMWVKARALAALSGRLPEAFSVDVAFRKPLFLPSTVALSTGAREGGWDLAVRAQAAGTDHVLGRVRPL